MLLREVDIYYVDMDEHGRTAGYAVRCFVKPDILESPPETSWLVTYDEYSQVLRIIRGSAISQIVPVVEEPPERISE